MRIVYKGNYIRMTCGEIGLVRTIRDCNKTPPDITEAAPWRGSRTVYPDSLSTPHSMTAMMRQHCTQF